MSRIVHRTVFQPIASVITHEDGSQTLEVDWSDSLLRVENAEGDLIESAAIEDNDSETLDAFLAHRGVKMSVETYDIPADLQEA